MSDIPSFLVDSDTDALNDDLDSCLSTRTTGMETNIAWLVLTTSAINRAVRSVLLQHL